MGISKPRRTFLQLLPAIAFCGLILGTMMARAEPVNPQPEGAWTTTALSLSERSRLTGDWRGGRPWLTEHGITLTPRLTLFYQGITAGNGDDHNFEFGGKADLLLDANLGKLGLWKGLSLNVHAEYNFGESVNQRGGTIMPVNTALMFPGMEGADAFDFSSVTLTQKFGDSISLLAGKISIIDYCVPKPFMGGGGIDSFWNIVFAAPPSGTVPAYFFGAILSVRTEAATYGVWVYDPNSSVNKSGLQDAFADGVTIRGSVSLPVTITGNTGHQGLAVSYSTKDGNDLSTLDGSNIPDPPPGTVGIKNSRYYFAYTFDQYLYRSKENPKEGVGLFGQFEISDGNPNKLYWMAFGGVGGTGLISGRSLDNWGLGYYYAALSPDMKDALAPTLTIRNEQGWEIFYNFAVTPWLVLGADLQIIAPGLADKTAVFAGLRTMIRF
jgi:porin